MGEFKLNTEEELEKKEDKNIECYGFKHEYVEFIDEEQTYRTKLRRQRDKILYTGGFRRLQDKTQVMSATKTGDHRTRLTHTLEVEQIAVSVADALGLNKDLVSAIALGHDVGHTPFGHAAERKLNELLKDKGGFHHPIQSIKYLWEKYGNKICYEVYDGILKHDADIFTVNLNNIKQQISCINYKDEKDENFDEEINDKFMEFINSQINKVPCTLEAQVVIWADKIAYLTHDFEDFTKSDIYYKLKESDKENNILTELEQIIKNITTHDLKNYKTRHLIRNLLDNLIIGSKENLQNYFENFKHTNKENLICEIQDITSNRISNSSYEKEKEQYLDGLIINFKDDEALNNYFRLRKFLDKYYIMCTSIQRSDAKAYKIIESLYKDFNNNIRLLPLDYIDKYKNNVQIIISNYLDIFQKEHKLYNEVKENKLFSKEIILEYMTKDIVNVLDNSIDKKVIDNYLKMIENIKREIDKFQGRVIADYISTMSDTYAKNTYADLNSSDDYFVL